MRSGKRETLFSKIFLLFLISFATIGNAQSLPIGGWRMHIPYKNCKYVTGSNSSIWCATGQGLFRLNKADNAVERITKIDGLGDLAISTIGYNPYNDILLVGYQTGNIDLIHGNEIINLPDIKHANIIGNKSIQNVYFVGKLAYVSTGFGIVVIDIDRREVKDTYLIGPNGTYLSILDIVSDGTTIFAATENGIYYAPINSPYLSNFNSWTKYGDILSNPSLTNGIYDAMIIYNGKLIVACAEAYPFLNWRQDKVFDLDLSTNIWETTFLNNLQPQFAWDSNNVHDLYVYNNNLYMVDVYETFEFNSSSPLIEIFPSNLGPGSAQQVYVDQSGIWVADKNFGLLKQISQYNGTAYYPNGPISTDAYSMTEANDQILVVPGGHDDAWNNVLNREGISSLTNGWWTNYDKHTIPQLDTTFDLLACAIDPNDANHYFLGSYGWGLMEIRNGVFDTLWNNYNSTLQPRPSSAQWCAVSGMQYDTSGNLWMVNSNVTSCLNVFKKDRTWQAFDFGSLIPFETNMGSMMITSTGQKWIIVPRNQGILVFDDNGTLSNTSDDKKKKLGFTAGIGNIPGTDVYSMAEDHDGNVWIGTDEGIAVFYCASTIFNSGGCDAQQILITQDTYVNILLLTQSVTAIAVDGANRKWIGTESGGVFLMSADGQKELEHFTAANSPLLSDDITSLIIDKATGEVFFGTTKGIVSYMGEANEGKEEMGTVYAYPNPVSHEYLGPIAITGLVKNADIKITDIRGEVVYKTTALGGRAIWDGNNFEGVRAATGVYLVFISNADGTQKAVTKILLIN